MYATMNLEEDQCVVRAVLGLGENRMTKLKHLTMRRSSVLWKVKGKGLEEEEADEKEVRMA